MTVTHADLANAIRALAMDAVQAANSGHPGMPMGMADAATVLFTQHLKFDPAWPEWPDRDRFVLSAGHGSMLAYALLHLTGYARPTLDDIRQFRQLGSPCAGHPENFELAGIEVTTGPLGQGLAMAVGMAIAERHLNARFGDALQDHRTWVIAGDGCLMEGINHEAVGLAGHLRLGRLNVIWDDNRITIDGATSLATSEDVKARYTASGWHVAECDGHDPASIEAAIGAAKADARPSLIACRTIIGYGAPNKQGTAATHGSPLGTAEVQAARDTLGWRHEAFEIPAAVLDAWRRAGSRGTELSAEWRINAEKQTHHAEFSAFFSGEAAARGGPALHAHIDALLAAPQTVATRKASELALGAINAAVPNTIGGSADLTGSNNTLTKGMEALTADNYGGRYIYYGIREFGMAAAMNGMALHGGIVPYGGTFLVFADYCRAAIRLSALQNAPVVYVMTHDSIGLGEDGPTHQPVEHLMSLRVMPNLAVMRPADTVETAECWAMALANTRGPSLLALSRQNLPQLRTAAGNLSAKGAYRLRPATAARQAVLVATGSEVHLAIAAADLLEADGIGCDVVSMPSWAHFDAQESTYRDDILPDGVLIASVEAGTTIGWERYTGRGGLRIGLDRFGASAPAEDLFAKFGFTADAVAAEVRSKLV